MYIKNLKLLAVAVISLTILGACSEDKASNQNNTKANLGAKLFSDANLSQNKTMSCASCHSLDGAMIDTRGIVSGHTYDINTGGSLGDNNTSIGDRNAPMAAYSFAAPEFHYDGDEGIFIGGFFHDGRAHTLKEQAKGPFLNPVEMNMTSESQVIGRILQNPEYVSSFKEIYGSNIFDNNLSAYDALADAVATFEQTKPFKNFDSKFDRFIDGDYSLSSLEKQGMNLFNGKAQCMACHPIDGYRPLITDFTYDNLGTPINTALRVLNGTVAVDNGLGAQVNDDSLNGAFKVASLRNIAVTSPYMHNGVFKNLATVVHFYNTRDINGINPETGATWAPAEVPLTVNHIELGDLKLSAQEEDAIVAFLKTFTDKKFEHLIP